jgi:ADP-ribosylglycohydrolase
VGGDTDTICAITGAVAEAYYGFPEEYIPLLTDLIEVECETREVRIINRFRTRFCSKEVSPACP